MKNRILVVEDDEVIRELIVMNLEAAGYETEALADGTETRQFLESGEAEGLDLALVDVMLPGEDGFELMGAFRRQGLPVIYLTAKGDVASKVRGLKLGAEDYMVKPFEVLELLVRIEKVLERTGRMRSLLEFGELAVDLKGRRVMEAGREVALKPMEFELLAVFMKNRNVVLGRDKLLDLVWGSGFYGETRTVDVHVAQLRKKIKACEAIRTVPKYGYLFEDRG